ncbi:hypothetical protein [Pontimicrobium sp. MEBiC01747]|jgi:hypothetical protein
MLSTQIETIEKEQIKYLKFPKEEVLTSKTEQNERCITLKRAMALGNLERGKVGILFMDNDGFKKVETTVWGVTDKSVILKESTVIPLKRILWVS